MAKYQDWEKIGAEWIQKNIKKAPSDENRNKIAEIVQKYTMSHYQSATLKRSVDINKVARKYYTARPLEPGDRVYVEFRDTEGTVDDRIDTAVYCIRLDDGRTIMCNRSELVKLKGTRPTEPNAAFRQKKAREKH